MLEDAIRYTSLGLSVIPVHSALHEDEAVRKRAVVPWKEFQERIATPNETQRHFHNGENIAIVCGDVSGNLEVLDFDAPALCQPFLDGLSGHDSALANKLVKVRTPSGGMHLLYRCAEQVSPNKKLAMPADGGKPLIETRGRGGYALTAPSAGYSIEGDLADIQTISKDERGLLIWLATTFDERPKTPPVAKEQYHIDRFRPGDVFNRRADWHQLLSEDGWSPGKVIGDRQHWTRPGKNDGTSATLHQERGLYVFSTSTELPIETPLDQFGYLAYVRFSGDFGEAARWVRKQYQEKFSNETEALPPAGTNTVTNKPNRSKFYFTAVDDLIREIRPTEWLIDGYLEANALSVLFADPASYKSFLAVDWGCSIATGTPWFGRPVKQGLVVFVIGEGQSGFARRIKAWEKGHGVSLDGCPIVVSASPAQMTSEESAKHVRACIDGLRPRWGKPVLVVFDTLARNFGPGDENSTADMTRFVGHLDTHIGNHCTRLLIHHTGHGDKSRGRGSSVLHGAVDAAYRLSRDKDSNMATLHCEKMKDAPEFEKVCIQAAEAEINLVGGLQETSLYLVEVEPPAGIRPKISEQMSLALSELQKLRADKVTETGDINCRLLVSEWVAACEREKVYSRTGFYKALDTMIARGYVERSGKYISLSSMS